MSLHVKSQKELDKWRKKGEQQQLRAVHGPELAQTFKRMSDEIKRLKKRVNALEKVEDNQARKAYAKTLQHDLQIAALSQRLVSAKAVNWDEGRSKIGYLGKI